MTETVPPPPAHETSGPATWPDNAPVVAVAINAHRPGSEDILIDPHDMRRFLVGLGVADKDQSRLNVLLAHRFDDVEEILVDGEGVRPSDTRRESLQELHEQRATGTYIPGANSAIIPLAAPSPSQAFFHEGQHFADDLHGTLESERMVKVRQFVYTLKAIGKLGISSLLTRAGRAQARADGIEQEYLTRPSEVRARSVQYDRATYQRYGHIIPRGRVM